MNNYGHAAFHKNELARLACGKAKVTRSDIDAVRRGLHNLARMGRIAPVGDKGSTLFCVMVNVDIAMRGAGKGNYKYLCSEPTHMDIRQTPYSPTTLAPEFTAPPELPDAEEWQDSPSSLIAEEWDDMERLAWPDGQDPWHDAWPDPDAADSDTDAAGSVSDAS